jgi:hypothetical protein
MMNRQQTARRTTSQPARVDSGRLSLLARIAFVAVLCMGGSSAARCAGGAEEPATKPAQPPPLASTLPAPRGLVRLAKDYDVWFDPKRKLVVVDGEVVLREGYLEMFACPRGTKEHESIVAVNCNAQFVHAGLLAAGAVAGRPVQFQPQYVPASGTTVDIWILWVDAQGKRHTARAQDWIKNVRTEKELEYTWVFAGSGFWTDETTRQRYYYGDGGDFICVSNFPSATLDLPVQSSQANDQLMFAAFTERIPPRGTKVRLVLVPRLEQKKTVDQGASAKPGS